jgi:hypothetical protein
LSRGRGEDWEALFERARDARANAVEIRLMLDNGRRRDEPSSDDGSSDREAETESI